MNAKDYTIGALADALRILELIARQNGRHTLSEIAAEADYNKSKVFRILHTLEAAKYVQKADEEGRYSLGPTILDLGAIASGRPNLPAIARPQMRGLLEQYGETVLLAILDGVDVLNLETLESTHRVRVAQSGGTSNGAHRTALGKAILAFLSESELANRLVQMDFTPATPNSITSIAELREELQTIRTRQFAIDDEESDIGVRCVGAPILGADGAPLAAISIEGPTERLSEALLAEMGTAVLAAAQACSRSLFGPSPSESV